MKKAKTAAAPKEDIWAKIDSVDAQEAVQRQEAPDWVKVIKPDYGYIRSLYIRIGFFGAVLVFLFQVALYIVFKFHLLPLEFKTSEFAHLMKYLIVPSILNFGTVGITWYMNRHYTKNETVLNMMPVFAMCMLCAVTASAHSVYSITLMLPSLPVFMASIYGRPKLLIYTGLMSVVGLISATICRSVSPYWTATVDTKMVPEVIAAYAFLLVAVLISMVLVNLLNTQKGRLFQVTREATRASRDAQEANRSKSEFLANMSHEIRTPLNAILGMTEVIKRESSEYNIKEYADDIQRSGNTLLALINDILDISKIESGKIELHESDYELGSLINDSYNMVAVRWREKGLAATVICDPKLPRMLCGDEYHLRQIIVNLLTNAVKYTNEGGIEMRVSGEENGDILRLEVLVKDTGIGIREEEIDKLFIKFNRLDYAKNRKIDGVGLGLSITKQLVELMNGTISVQSEYGVGSTFTVRIPQKIVDRTPIGDIHSTYLNVHEDLEQYHQSFEAPDALVLVVDDMAINLQVIRKLLEATRIEVDTAISGKVCLEKVRQRKYDLILMDHMMPELDGVQTLLAMQKLPDSKNKDVPVIMLTANAMVGAREEYLSAGFVDYLSKPVRGMRLEQMLLRHLPAEKVQRSGPAQPIEEEAPSFSMDRLCQVLPEIDAHSGVAYCADDIDFYRNMLVEFVDGARDKELEHSYNAGDWTNYRITAHSLKSAARMVGLNALSEESLALEDAAKRQELETIAQQHRVVINHYRAISAALHSILD